MTIESAFPPIDGSTPSGSITVGKRVAARLYAHTLLISHLSEHERHPIEDAIRISGLSPGQHFDVVRFDRERDEVALLSYPTFFSEPFPSLLASWRVHLATNGVRFRDYSSSLNPPVLHRKELMIPGDHPDAERFRTLTRVAEELGLFDDPVRIGFREQWLQLVASKGYEIVGHELVPLANTAADSPPASVASPSFSTPIRRHLTALSRTFLSAPVQALIRHDLLTPKETFFDYGCGKGDDIEHLRTLGINAQGWDPYFRPEGIREAAEVVNLGFVINVIEDLQERIDALKRAYDLTKGVISIATILWSSTAAHGRPSGDGFVSSRNTFQKYFSQGELQTFIESVLDEQAVPIGPGIYFVFKDRHLEQRFLSRRQSDSKRPERLIAIRPRLPRAQRVQQHARAPKTLDPAQTSAAHELCRGILELGRIPDSDEYANSAQLIQLFGTWGRAVKAALLDVDETALRDAGQARSDEIRAFFAMQAFSRRRPLRDLEPRLRRDVKAFFGSLTTAETEGRRLLYQCADVDLIKRACETAAAKGIGWLDSDHSLQLHTSLVERLEPVLRVYVGCATALYGDVLSADLIKIHIQSGKVTLLRFDDFLGKPLPRLVERVKVRLRDQDLDYFEYGEQFKPPLLYLKSRFINEEFPEYAEQAQLDDQLGALGLDISDGHGPDGDQFDRWLLSKRLELKGMRLVPATTVPSLDEPCGRYLTFRQLCECGETWERLHIENSPASAATFNALNDLATNVLDQVIEYFGSIKLTYGFASASLTRHIKARIAPKLDQHASCEVGRGGSAICSRAGAAVDFYVEYENMLEVVQWIVANCAFDRIYYYGPDRPIHVSYGPQLSREAYELTSKGGRRLPRRLSLPD